MAFIKNGDGKVLEVFKESETLEHPPKLSKEDEEKNKELPSSKNEEIKNKVKMINTKENLFKCGSCNYLLPRNNEYFNKNKNIQDNLQLTCRNCCKKYKDNNKEKINATRRKYYKNKKEKFSKQAKFKWQNMSEEMKKNRLIYFSDYYKKTKKERSEKNKIWRLANKEYLYLRNRARELKIKEYVKITQKQIELLLNSYNNKCIYCAVDVFRGINLHLDHKVPLSRNGDHTLENLVPSCKVCNLKKGTKTFEEFT